MCEGGWCRRPEPRHSFPKGEKCAVKCGELHKTRQNPTYRPTFVGADRQRQSLCAGASAPDRDARHWDDECDPFNSTAAGYLGRRRKSMLRNPLLVKPQLGTPLRTRELPCDDYIYGYAPIPTYKAADALRGWAGTLPKQKQLSSLTHRPMPPDTTNFLKLNAAAVTAGACGERELRDFRNTHRIKYGVRQRDLKKDIQVPDVRIDPRGVAGKPTIYETTAAEIMTDKTMRDWIHCVKTCNPEKAPLKEYNSWKNWRQNNASSLRMYTKKTDLKPETLWHMPKFEKKAKPHLSTFRSTPELLAAHNTNNYEKVGRDGMFGVGIPTKAVNKRDSLYRHKA